MSKRAIRSGRDGYARRRSVLSPELAFLLIFGQKTTSTERHCLRAICHLLTSLPVPSVSCWCQDEGQGFIYLYLESVRTDCWRIRRAQVARSWRKRIRHLADVDNTLSTCPLVRHETPGLYDTTRTADEGSTLGDIHFTASYPQIVIKPRQHPSIP